MPSSGWRSVNQRNAFILFVLLVTSVYADTFHAPWQFDDYPNIVHNSRLHLKDLKPQSLLMTFHGILGSDPYAQKKLYRPVAGMTFALNWYMGQERVFGYHLINTVIHICTSFLLYITIIGLLHTPALINRYAGQSPSIALLGVVLWVLHPIQTQAVTYIVQRMTSLAAMFYLLGVYCYLKGRVSRSTQKGVVFFVACTLSYLLAIGSKENAVMLPIALLLIETIFFQKGGLGKSKTIRVVMLAGFAGLAVAGAYFLIGHRLDAIFTGYQERPFTLIQRIMTQPRVVVYYLTQIAYPIPNRLSVVHDIVVSTSLGKPFTTLPAMALIGLLLGLGFSQIKKRPLVALSILFFLVNHLVESTILPLEMAFEHRNYLPSLFLFAPIAAALVQAQAYYQEHSRFMLVALSVFVILLIIACGTSTHLRNAKWTTEKTLWEDVLRKYPHLARPYQKLGGFYKEHGNSPAALALYKKSLELKDPRPKQSQTLALNNMATIYLEKGDYGKAIALCQKALSINSDYHYARYNLVLAFINQRLLDKALKNIDQVILKNPDQGEYLNLRGFILIKQKKFHQALPCFRQALRLDQKHRGALVNLGVALSMIGEYEKAEWFLVRAHKTYARDPIILLSLIDNNLRWKNSTGADRYLYMLLDVISIEDIRILLKTLPQHGVSLPLSPGSLREVIAAKIEAKSKRILLLQRN